MTPEKRQFLKKLAPGVRELLDSNRIGLEPKNDTEKFIKRQLLSHNGDGTYELSIGKFKIAMGVLDDEILYTIFVYLDTSGITIRRVYRYMKLNVLEFSLEEHRFVDMIVDEDIETFYDFLSY